MGTSLGIEPKLKIITLTHHERLKKATLELYF